MTLQCTDRAPHQKVQQRYRITYTSSTEKHTETNVQETAVPGIGDGNSNNYAPTTQSFSKNSINGSYLANSL